MPLKVEIEKRKKMRTVPTTKVYKISSTGYLFDIQQDLADLKIYTCLHSKV